MIVSMPVGYTHRMMAGASGTLRGDAMLQSGQYDKGNLMSTIICDVVAKNRTLFSGELYSLVVPATEGDMGILENHAPTMAALRDGIIWGRSDSVTGPIISAAIMGGYVQVIGNRVIVLCEKTRELKDIDIERLEEAIPELEAQVAGLTEEQFISNSVLRRKLRWCNVMYGAKRKALDDKLPFRYED